MTEKLDKEVVRGIVGLENYEEVEKMPYLILVNSGKKARELEANEGDVVNAKTGKVVSKDGVLKFIPVDFYKEWVVWSDENLIAKRALTKEGMWSDGTVIKPSDFLEKKMNDRGKEVPVVTEHWNFIVLTLDQVKEENPDYAILSFNFTNSHRITAAKNLLHKLGKVCVTNNFPEVFRGAYYINIELVENKDGDEWYDYTTCDFIKEVQESNVAKCRKINAATKDKYALLNMGNAIVEEAPENLQSAKPAAQATAQKQVEAKKEEPVIVEAEVTEISEAEVDEDASF